jgi:uncharacterized protein HemX
MGKTRVACALAILALLTIGAGTVAVAQSQCEQDCQDQYDLDVQTCEDELAAKLANLQQDEQACVDKWNGSTQQLDNCLKSVNVQRRNAQRQYQQCLRQAQNKLRVCLSKCAESPSAS